MSNEQSGLQTGAVKSLTAAAAGVCGAVGLLSLLWNEWARHRNTHEQASYAPERENEPSTSHLKLVAVDLDNTLWPGVLAEGLRPAGWEAHRSLQKVLMQLQECGVLLATCSRNDELVVMENWPPPHLCRLQPAHFVAHHFGWGPKSKRLIDFAELIGVRHESIIFIDDQAPERDEVRAGCPNARCAPPNPSTRSGRANILPATLSASQVVQMLIERQPAYLFLSP